MSICDDLFNTSSLPRGSGFRLQDNQTNIHVSPRGGEQALTSDYALGIFVDTPRTKAERAGPDILRAVTGVTGGRTFPIYTLKKIGDAVSELSMELRNQYLIAYRPLNLVHDGKWHKITLRMMPPQNFRRLRVYARAGYYAPAK